MSSGWPLRSVVALIGVSFCAFTASAKDKIVFGTNWLAEAEHGGYYQAIADGTYAAYDLDVSIKSGGPQATCELLAAGALQIGFVTNSFVPLLAEGRRRDNRCRHHLPEGSASVDGASRSGI